MEWYVIVVVVLVVIKNDNNTNNNNNSHNNFLHYYSDYVFCIIASSINIIGMCIMIFIIIVTITVTSIWQILVNRRLWAAITRLAVEDTV